MEELFRLKLNELNVLLKNCAIINLTVECIKSAPIKGSKEIVGRDPVNDYPLYLCNGICEYSIHVLLGTGDEISFPSFSYTSEYESLDFYRLTNEKNCLTSITERYSPPDFREKNEVIENIENQCFYIMNTLLLNGFNIKQNIVDMFCNNKIRKLYLLKEQPSYSYIITALRDAKKMHESGILTDEQFEIVKFRILNI